jgi:hypothetical protein
LGGGFFSVGLSGQTLSMAAGKATRRFFISEKDFLKIFFTLNNLIFFFFEWKIAIFYPSTETNERRFLGGLGTDRYFVGDASATFDGLLGTLSISSI